MGRDLSHVEYWTLIAWREDAAWTETENSLAGYDDDGHNRDWMADLDAEITHQEKRLAGQPPPNGFDIEYSPMWLDGCNAYCVFACNHWVETAYEKDAREGFEAWLKLETEKTRARLERR